MKNQRGFTLIELIIVIVVLGILAVTAAPQFIDFSSDARTSSVQGLKGSLQGATQTSYAKAAIEGKLDNGTEQTLANDVVVIAGYPRATAAGIINAAGLSAYDTSSDNSTDPYGGEDWLFTTDGESIYIAAAGNVEDKNASLTDGSASDCQVDYTESQNENIPPVIEVFTEGC